MSSPERRSAPNFPVPFVFSQASLQDYSDCARRFSLRYLEQMVWPAVESEPIAEFENRQQSGLLFHRLVHQHLLGLPAEELGRLATGPDLSRWWHNYLDSNLGLDGYSLHAELVLSTPIGPHRLVAKYDLVAIQDGRAIIFDWKTYARRPSQEHLAGRWQTRVYRWLLARAGGFLNGGRSIRPQDIQMIYWFAEFPSQPIMFRYDQAQQELDRSALETLVAEISNATEFPLTDELKQCRFCAFRSYCDRGQEAGAWKEAETDSELEVGLDFNFEQIQEIEF